MTKAHENTPTFTGLADLPVAAYCCDRDGLISFYNTRAAELWGREPRLMDAEERYCGSWRLWHTNGTPLRHDETPMALALREGVTIRNQHVVIEQPNGNRVRVNVNISPTLDADGAIAGAVNVFSEVAPEATSLRSPGEHVEQLIDALGVAVYTTDTEGRILSFNQQAVDLWGRTARDRTRPVVRLLAHLHDGRRTDTACRVPHGAGTAGGSQHSRRRDRH